MKQLHRWQDFRKWQNDNRGLEDDDGGYPAYLERWKHIVKRSFLPTLRDKCLAEIEADPSCRKSQWENKQWERERQRDHCRERGCRGFRDYTEAVKRRLARHGFTQSFELNEDPKKQDKLATWIEYLNYEYWWLDKHTGDIERLEPEHDKLWQELVDTNILRTHETKEFVRTNTSGMERQRDEDQARKAVQRADDEAERIYVLTQEDPKRLLIPQAKRISMLKHAAQELQAAKRQSEQAERRSHLIGQFIRATWDYDKAKRDAARHRILVQWVLEQVPLVDAEVNPSKANRLESGERRRTKRRRTIDEEPPKKQNPKRVKVDVVESRVAGTKARSKTMRTRAEPGTVMGQGVAQGPQPENPASGYLHPNGVGSMPQGPRRSARITARRNAPSIALQPDISQLRAPSSSEEMSAQPRRPNSVLQDAGAPKMRRQSRCSKQGGIAKSTPSSPKRRRRRRNG